MATQKIPQFPKAVGLIGQSMNKQFDAAVKARGKHGTIQRGKDAFDAKVVDAQGKPVAERMASPKEDIVELYDTKGDVTVMGDFNADGKVDYVEVHPNRQKAPSVVGDDANKDGKPDWVATQTSNNTYHIQEDPHFDGTWPVDQTKKVK
jgi:hypothetical protein